MIKATQIIEALDIKRIDGEEVLISVDPSSLSETLRDLQDFTRTAEFKDEPILKFTLDVRKDLFLVWCAYQTHHKKMGGAYYKDFWGERGDEALWGVIDVGKKTYSVKVPGVPGITRAGVRKDLGEIDFDKDLATKAGYPTDLPNWDKCIEHLRRYLYGFSSASPSLLGWVN